MIDAFTAVRDALHFDSAPDWPRPWYLSAEPVRDLAKGRAQMAALAARYPRNVKGF